MSSSPVVELVTWSLAVPPECVSYPIATRGLLTWAILDAPCYTTEAVTLCRSRGYSHKRRGTNSWCDGDLDTIAG
jgi:hypothetical protein